jgi:hypothetical protein
MQFLMGLMELFMAAGVWELFENGPRSFAK